MGYLWDRWTGTRHAEPGTRVLPTQQLRDALLALNDSGVPFRIRETGVGGADLVAEWRVLEPATGIGLTRRQVDRTLKVWLSLRPREREVRAIDEQFEVTRAGAPPGRVVARAQGRGPIRGMRKRWVYEKGPDGRRHKVVTFEFDSRQLKNPLRTTVLQAGWTWRGVYRF
ncbi:hypothetical protein OG625_28200 [Streptomyces sp. NBC_01351]|uniref:hypothetical protein n=1 Tax=Streptomyces sp. NBC_01351 TaxID=2903833 RepID=UPI002E2ED869|nr:hypothetical protein [Streptomyces sp. NBC_01351]